MSILHRITVDKGKGKLFGVCAGIAKAFGYSRLSVRIGTVIGLFFLPVIFITVYATAAILLPSREQLQ